MRPGSLARVSWRSLRLGEHLLTGAVLTALLHREARDGRTGRRHPGVIAWWHRRLCRILGLSIETGGHPLPTDGLIVANHVSWLDIPVLGSLCPTAFLSKAEVRRWPLVGWLAGAAGTLFISRGASRGRKVADHMSVYLSARHLLTVFPEGTTSDGSSVLRFHPRLFAAAVESASPIQPVAIRYFEDDRLDPVAPFIGEESFAHHLWRVLRQPRIRVEIAFCAPLAPPYPGRRELAEATRESIIGELPEVSKPRAPQTEKIPLPAADGVLHG